MTPIPQRTISPTPIPTESIRGPVSVDGQLPEIRTLETVTTVSGVQVEAQSQLLPTGGQQIELPSGTIVSIDAKRKNQTDGSVSAPTGVLQIARGESLIFEARGLKPGSTVEIWLFSTPRLLGVVPVNADGTLNVDIPLPSDVPIGEHTAQVSGLDVQGSEISVNAGLEIVALSEPETNNNYLLMFAIALVVSTGFALYGFRFVRRKKSDS